MRAWLTGRVAAAVVATLLTLVVGVPAVRELLPEGAAECLEGVQPDALRQSGSSSSNSLVQG